MAEFIKKSLEEKIENSCWHVIVGTHFGSYVSYEHKSMNLFFLEHIGFLLYRHGWKTGQGVAGNKNSKNEK